METDEGEENLLLQIPAEGSDPERSLMEQVMDERLQKALAALPEPFRIAVLLCDVEGKSYEEIAQIMNSSIGTVRSRIHRGRLQLRRALESPKATPATTRSSVRSLSRRRQEPGLLANAA